MTVAPSGAMPARTSLMRSPSMRTSARVVASAVTTVPFWMRVVIVRAFFRRGGAETRRSCAGPLRPTLRWTAGVDLFHGDAILYGADQPAEIAADALRFIDVRDAIRGRGVTITIHRHGIELCDRGYGDVLGWLVEVDALMRAVPAGDIAEIAANARFAIDTR